MSTDPTYNKDLANLVKKFCIALINRDTSAIEQLTVGGAKAGVGGGGAGVDLSDLKVQEHHILANDDRAMVAFTDKQGRPQAMGYFNLQGRQIQPDWNIFGSVTGTRR